MAKRLQLRRGTTTEHASFTGVVGEVTVDTDKDTAVVHDGSLAGGHPLATATNFRSTGIDDNANALAITIDSSERVGIGVAPDTANENILSIKPNAHRLVQHRTYNVGADSAYVTRVTHADSPYNVREVGLEGSHVRFYTGSEGGTATTKSMDIGQTGDVTVNTGDLIFGTAGKGVVLGATTNVAANTLDDYEEGTWTVDIRSNNGQVPSKSNVVCTYTKIGRLVHIEFSMEITSWGTGIGIAYILNSCLPFDPVSETRIAGTYGGNCIALPTENVGTPNWIFTGSNPSTAGLQFWNGDNSTAMPTCTVGDYGAEMRYYTNE